MNHQYRSLRNIAETLKTQPELTQQQRDIWKALTTPANIVELLDTVEAELNRYKEREVAA